MEIIAAGWAPGDCTGTPHPVTLTIVPAGKLSAALGTATPDAAGAFDQSFGFANVGAGDTVSLTQAACDGSALSLTATIT